MPDVTRIGPLWLAQPGADAGFITHQPLTGMVRSELADLVAQALGWFGRRAVTEVEWKTRGHDATPELIPLLESHGFAGEDVETVLAGAALALAGPGDVAGAIVRQAGSRGDLHGDVQRSAALQDLVFDRSDPGTVPRLLDRIAAHRTQLWLAEADGEVVGAGRVDAVRGTEFAGLWGGAVRPDWRGRGVYRALTQARARAALSGGARYLYADCTQMSRPILERCGLIALTTTTPYVWSASQP